MKGNYTDDGNYSSWLLQNSRNPSSDWQCKCHNGEEQERDRFQIKQAYYKVQEGTTKNHW